MANHEDIRDTILVVDDTPANLGTLFECLHNLGYSVLLAQSGEDALELLKEKIPDLILLDILMPEMDGFTLCRCIKANPQTRDIPILFITASDNIEHKLIGFQVGGIDYITKPFQQEEVLARIQTHLKLQHLRQDLEKHNIQLQQEIEIRKKTEQELAQAKEVAELAKKAQGLFLAHISHETRNLLHAIINSVQLLNYTNLDDQQNEYMSTLIQSSDMLLYIINDILDFAKIESGKLEFVIKDFNLVYMIQQTLQILMPKVLGKHLQLHWSIEAELGENWRGDSIRICQILLNLLGNALKFTTHGFVHLHVQQIIVNSQTMLRFEIRDTGPGISPEQQALLFEPFSQLSHVREGTGLGLAICKKLVELMNGQIGVQSELGKGSTFWFTLPLSPAAMRADELAPQEKRTVTLAKPRRVLLVEDDPINQKVDSIILVQLGVEVDISNDGHEALQYLQENSYDAILMDLELPEMDGMELAQMIRDPNSRALQHDVPIIALTAHTDAQEECLHAGMTGYITKPIQPDILWTTLTQYFPLPDQSNSKHKRPIAPLMYGKKIFDYEAFLHHVGDDWELYHSILQTVPSDLHKQITKLQAYIQAKDAAGAMGQARTIKGMMANLAAHRIQDVAYEIELAGKKGDLLQLQELEKQLLTEAELFLEELAAHTAAD